MKLFARRNPVAWAVLAFGLFFAASLIYSATTGDVYVPASRKGGDRRSKHILQASDPQKFADWLRFYGVCAVIGVTFAFVRVVPLEDGWRQLRERSKSTIQEKGYDSKPAPKWAYAVLLGALGLVAWVGWKTLFS
ncbi:MAG: hypothetical protein ABIY47_03080 [Opitutaceae bacterium]